jgi:hypothetical protein
MAAQPRQRRRKAVSSNAVDGHKNLSFDEPFERLAGERAAPARALSIARQIAIESLPAWLAVSAIVGLIFGGCCSNVYALEAIVK